MSERLTGEQLRKEMQRIERDNDIAALRARVAKLEEALTSLIDLRVRIDDMRQANKGMAVERDASRARVAKLEEALRFLIEETKWKSVDRDNMEFEGRITCYQLDQARAALKDAPQ